MSDYKSAGVDRIGSANWVGGLSASIQSTFRPEVLSRIGGYGALFEAPASYKRPVWVATTDGVGTKLLLAEEAGDEAFFSIGIDAVGMCVNDLLACRAEPIIFLDYLALDRLMPSRMNFLLQGMIEGCRQAACSLVGGETAEMPGFYPKGRLDVAGFSLGVIEKDQIWKNEEIPSDLRLVGFRSHGFHSNGFSLIRRVMEAQAWKLDSQIEGQSLGEYLLKPTRIYVRMLLQSLRSEGVFGAAHITGGGLIENLPRIFPANLQAVIESERISTDDIMLSFVEASGCDRLEAFSTWNMGVGFVVLATASKAQTLISEFPMDAFEIGYLEARTSTEAVILR